MMTMMTMIIIVTMMTMGGNDDMQGDRSRGRDCHSWHSKVKPVILKDDQDHDDYNDGDDDRDQSC